MSELKARLRAVPTLTGTPPPFDPDHVTSDPHELFVAWLTTAIDSHVPEPLAATLSTIGVDGHPSARVLILKDIDERGWRFATSSGSRKGRELAAHPHAALTFYWIPLGRQVCLRGTVEPADPAESAADFLSRPPGARAQGLVGKQSQPLDDRADLDTAQHEAEQRIHADPDLVAPTWTLYTLRANEVEFWQSDPRRQHLRLTYTKGEDGTWTSTLLWP